MPSQQRINDLQTIWLAIKYLFPENAEVYRHALAENNFIISWDLLEQPPKFTQVAREVSMRFAEKSLIEYAALDISGKDSVHRAICEIVKVSMATYTTGVGLSRGEAKDPHIIEIRF